MSKTCPKCGYERLESDSAPDYECPKCGAIYAKVEARLAEQSDMRPSGERYPQAKPSPDDGSSISDKVPGSRHDTSGESTKFERRGTLFLLVSFQVAYLAVMASTAAITFKIGGGLFALTATIAKAGLGSGFRVLLIWGQIALAAFMVFCCVKAWKRYAESDLLPACIWICLPQAFLALLTGLVSLFAFVR